MIYFSGLARGDLGIDVFSNRPVARIVGEQLPFTLELIFSSILWSAFLGVLLGCYSACRRNSPADRLLAILSVAFVSTPAFVVALYLLLVFAVALQWLPAIGAGEAGDFVDRARHLVLPSLAIGIGWVGYIARLVRASMLEVLAAPHIRVARAFGLPPRWIVFRYALRVAILPVVALLGVGMGFLLSAAVFAEVVFARPGNRQIDYRFDFDPQLSGRDGRGFGFHAAFRRLDRGRRYRQRRARSARARGSMTAVRSPPGVLARIARAPFGLTGLLLVCLVVFGALFADWIVPYDPNALNLPDRMQAPSAAHWLGTDQLGRDHFFAHRHGRARRFANRAAGDRDCACSRIFARRGGRAGSALARCGDGAALR